MALALPTNCDSRKALIDWLVTLPKPYLSPAVEHGESRISGFGTIAKRPIEIGEIPIVQCGPVVDYGLMVIFESLGYETNLCINWDKYRMHAPMSDLYSGGYINHSCDPTAGLLTDNVWTAIVPVDAGQEITCDYGTFETATTWAVECRCGAAQCRQTITGRDYLLPELRARLGKWYAPYLRLP